MFGFVAWRRVMSRQSSVEEEEAAVNALSSQQAEQSQISVKTAQVQRPARASGLSKQPTNAVADSDAVMVVVVVVIAAAAASASALKAARCALTSESPEPVICPIFHSLF